MIGQTLSLLHAMYEALGFRLILAMAFPAFLALGVVILLGALRRNRTSQEVAGD